MEGVIASNFWDDRINDAPGIPGTTWFFSQAGGIAGFGGDFDLAGPRGSGTGVLVLVNLLGGGSGVVGEIPRTLAGTFWGFTSVSPFSSVEFSEGTQGAGPGSVESYDLDDLSYAEANLAAVPEPATVALVAGGLAALGAVGRLRRRAR